MRKVLLLALVVGLVMVMTVPAGAVRAEKTEYTRVECVYATGAPEVNEYVGKDGMIWHVRGLPYLGYLSVDTTFGTNEGTVDIDLNLKEGTGSIRGTLSIDDPEMGRFDGTFSAHSKNFVWEGRGSAVGIGDDAGKLLEVRLQGLDSGTACASALDAFYWEVVIIDTRA